ncbi:phospholipase, partial [Verticillium dahliae]
MKLRSSTFWLGLGSYENTTDLVVSNRPRQVTAQTSRPNSQRPSLLVLVGHKAKTAALHELFGVRRTQQAGAPSGSADIHLHLASQSIFYERPLLIAEGGFPDGDSEAFPKACPQDVRRRTVMRPTQRAAKDHAADELYSRLLRPFGDVFCFFSDDLGGLEGVAHHLMTWLDRDDDCQVLASTRPRIIIATSTVPHGAESERKAKMDLLEILEKGTGKFPSALASHIEVVALFPQARISATARHRALKERLMRSSDEVRQSRVDARCLFSAIHFAAFLDVACDHFASTPDAPFDFIQGSRSRDPVPRDLESHIANFLCHIKSPADMTDFAVPLLGSSLSLDAYPPGGHFFDPVDIFKGLYDGMLHQVFSNGTTGRNELSNTFVGSGLVSQVKAYFSHWLRVHSTRVCLSCLSHIPQHGMPCGHVHCDNCVWDYGSPSGKDPWTPLYSKCHLCDGLLPEEAVIRRHPPTAGVGVFCLDGGGVRGIVSLEILKRIQDSIKLPIPLTRFIKVFFGISSVGLPVATIDKKPLERIFTNYNGVGTRQEDQGVLIGSFFPPKHIRGVGSFQDAGPLVDPTLSALCEVAALFPLLDEPDYVVSIGTGESQPSNSAATDDMRSAWRNGALPRLGRLFWEKMSDKKVRQVFQMRSRYHRLNVHFEGNEPMLDSAPSMPEMGRKARKDPSLEEPIAYLCRCMIASLFYFELDALPERLGGRYVGTGTILCTIRRSEQGFQELFSLMSDNSAQIVVNDRPLSTVNDPTCFDKEGNFRKLVELDTYGRLTISLREGTSAACHISNSPFTIERLVALQGLDAVFGRRNSRKTRSKRKDANVESGPQKRRRVV